MALKLDTPMMATAYHVNDGPVQMYAVDARQAIALHPDEWSAGPWSPDDASEARKRLHERRVAEAKAAGAPEPAPLVEPELTDADRAEFEEWRANRAKAQEILDAARKEQDEADAKAAEVAQARAVVESPAPQPQPRRPLTGAAKANAERSAEKRAADEKTAADKAAAEKSARDKAEADRLAAAKV